MSRIMMAAAVAALMGCGGSESDVVGDYGGQDCVWQFVSLRDDGSVHVSMNGSMFVPRGRYEVAGDTVTIRDDLRGPQVYTRQGDMLVSGLSRCRKV